jgi:hypothetical protein
LGKAPSTGLNFLYNDKLSSLTWGVCVSQAAAQGFVSDIDGLSERSADGTNRARYCCGLLKGSPLTLTFNGQAVSVMHDGREIGRLSARRDWVAAQLAAGRRLRCAVVSIKTRGLWRLRYASRVEVTIAADDDDSFAAKARWLAEGGAAAIRATSEFTANSARRAGGAVIEGGSAGIRASSGIARGSAEFASRVGGSLVNYGVRKPARFVGQGLGSVADVTVRRPVRAFQRLVRNIFLAAVTILVLVLAIVVIWRVPSLPGFGFNPPPFIPSR